MNPEHTTQEQPAEPQGRWYAADDIDLLVRELDVMINGEEGAAPQAQLADIVAQLRKGAPAPTVAPEAVRFPTMLRKMWSGGEVQQWLEDHGPLYRNAKPLMVADVCTWSDRQVLDFIGVALRNVKVVGDLHFSEIRQGFVFMRDKTQ